MAVSQAFVAFLIVSHMTVSSTMLVLNKAVLKAIPAPTTVLLFQVGSSALILWVIGKAGLLSVDAFEMKKARLFLLNAIAFMVLLFTNAKALESANVETVIVFRTLSIFVTVWGDFRLLGGQLINLRAFASLGVVVAGAIGYVLSDKGFMVSNMFWVFCYGAANAAYPLVTKIIILSNDSMTSWGRTYYNNFMTFMVFLPGMFVLGEHHILEDVDGIFNTHAVVLLVASCIWGTAISFLGFLCIENVSATTFNVMGNSNKLLTLVINGILWDHHASFQANLCLIVSLSGAALYAAFVNKVKKAIDPPKAVVPSDRRETPLNDLEARGGSGSGQAR